MRRLGLDIGSTATKAVLLSEDSRDIQAALIRPTGNNPAKTVADLAMEICAGQLPDNICATGYGRRLAEFATRCVTEITCHAAGVKAAHPEVCTIIDIGGQDSKVIRLDQNGAVVDFVMNDKCAAGTGSFLDAVARRFNLTPEQMAEKCLQSATPLPISATCAVFAESEIIGLLAEGKHLNDIICGVHASIAARISRLFAQTGGTAPVYFSGGVAKNPGMVRALSKELGVEVKTAAQPQIMGAYGAALLA